MTAKIFDIKLCPLDALATYSRKNESSNRLFPSESFKNLTKNLLSFVRAMESPPFPPPALRDAKSKLSLKKSSSIDSARLNTEN